MIQTSSIRSWGLSATSPAPFAWPAGTRAPQSAPAQGEHTAAVLSEFAGYGDEQIRALAGDAPEPMTRS